jgi:hypothetical protein
VLEQARIFNPNSTIYLLGDESNNKFKKMGIEHYYMADFSESTKEFQKIYKHQSPNTYDAELFCFQRWFIIRNFITQKGISNFLYLDSDVLIYGNVDVLFNEYLDFDFTIVDHSCPSTTLFKRESLNAFCDFINELYTQKDYLGVLDNLHKDYCDGIRSCGNSDMTAFELYQIYKNAKVKELTTIENNACFDHNIGAIDNFVEKNGFKEIYWIDDKPYAKRQDNQQLILFHCLHFNGIAKRKMYNYRINSKRQHIGGIFYKLKSELSIGLVIRVIKRYITKIVHCDKKLK